LIREGDHKRIGVVAAISAGGWCAARLQRRHIMVAITQVLAYRSADFLPPGRCGSCFSAAPS
jgi:hypothetical protein